MSDFTVRPVAEGEQRACRAVLARSLHAQAFDDKQWDAMSASFPAERKFAAFDGETPIGIVSSFATELLVPGGKVLSTAAVDGVGVRADWTRRGVLTAMMARQLPDFVERGHVLAALHASESTIYGRFGYGPATSIKSVRLRKPRAKWREEVPANGRVRFLTADEAVKLVPEIYRRIGLYRPGMIARPDVWWPANFDTRVTSPGTFQVAAHTGPDGDDGYAVFTVVDQRTFDRPETGAAVQIRELRASSPEAVAGLWRFLLNIDLVSEVRGRGRPADEPIAGMLTDLRSCEVVGAGDELWVRLVDVEAALDARTYSDAEPVVLEVHDRRLPANSGRYRVGPDGAARTDAAPEVRLDVDVLAMLYLGEWTATALAQCGRLEVLDRAALPRLDELFRSATIPWCGTNF
ncbi:GNAT family N-acetyltransferase [Amycolatopsis sp.]|uniref:GNAT family N-acetyltransferase n=1 Tax=Amycolatopsis sp. TaxID=37632 RepID=UPI002DFDFFC1|nr:GNAT family N-acetyltransferase [Amycolatopsis sp.]